MKKSIRKCKFQAGDIIKNFAGEHMFVVSLLNYDRYNLYYMQHPVTVRHVFIEIADKGCELVQRVEG